MAYSELGTDMGTVATAGASSVIPGGGIIGSVFGGILAKDKNPGRLAANLAALNAGKAGQQYRDNDGNVWDAADYLLDRSKNWATQVAKADALAKYNALVAYRKSGKVTSSGGVAGKPVSGIGGISPLVIVAALGGIYFLTQRR